MGRPEEPLQSDGVVGDGGTSAIGLRWTSATRPGRHGLSQDRHALEKLVVGGKRFTIAIVADGAGGVAGGARAAELAVATALERGRRAPPRDAGDLCVLLAEVDAAVAADAEAGLAALAVVVVSETQVLAGSVDDAEVWLDSDQGWHVLDGKRRYGSGLAIGTSTALYDVASLPRDAVATLILWSDGAWGPQHIAEIEARLQPCDVQSSDLMPPEALADDDATIVLGVRLRSAS